MKKLILLTAVLINSCFAAFNCNLVVNTTPEKGESKGKGFSKDFILYAHSIDQTSTYIPDEDFKLISKESLELESMALYFETKKNKFNGSIRFPFNKELTKINYAGNLTQGTTASSIQLNCTKI